MFFSNSPNVRSMVIKAKDLQRGMRPIGERYEGYSVERVIDYGGNGGVGVYVEFVEDDGETSWGVDCAKDKTFEIAY